MKIDRISYSKTFTLNDKWEKIGVEAELGPGDDLDKCFEELKAWVSSKYVHPVKTDSEKAINRQHERIQIWIENAKTEGQLLTLKDKVPEHLQALFDHRLNQLHHD